MANNPDGNLSINCSSRTLPPLGVHDGKKGAKAFFIAVPILTNGRLNLARDVELYRSVRLLDPFVPKMRRGVMNKSWHYKGDEGRGWKTMGVDNSAFARDEKKQDLTP